MDQIGQEGAKQATTATEIHEGSVYDNDDNITIFDLMPPGFRFCPPDEKLLDSYLKRKIMNQPLPMNQIHEVELYKYNPDDLTEKYTPYDGENNWYFFSPRDRKYKNGSRPNRAAGNGYWKASGKAIEIKIDEETTGFRTTLVFYIGKAPKGEKSIWSMHEYLIGNSLATSRTNKEPKDMKLDDWVLCQLYKQQERRQVHDAKAQVDGVIAEDSKKRKLHHTEAQVQGGVIAEDSKKRRVHHTKAQLQSGVIAEDSIKRQILDQRIPQKINVCSPTLPQEYLQGNHVETPNNPNSPVQVNGSEDIGQVNNFKWINSSGERSVFSYGYSQNPSLIHEYRDPNSVEAVSTNSNEPSTIFDYRYPTSVQPASINSSTQYFTDTLHQPTGYRDPTSVNSALINSSMNFTNTVHQQTGYRDPTSVQPASINSSTQYLTNTVHQQTGYRDPTSVNSALINSSMNFTNTVHQQTGYRDPTSVQPASINSSTQYLTNTVHQPTGYRDPTSGNSAFINSSIHFTNNVHQQTGYRDPTSVQPASINSSTQYFTNTLHQPTGYRDPTSALINSSMHFTNTVHQQTGYRDPTSVQPASINSSTQYLTNTLHQPTGYRDPTSVNSAFVNSSMHFTNTAQQQTGHRDPTSVQPASTNLPMHQQNEYASNDPWDLNLEMYYNPNCNFGPP